MMDNLSRRTASLFVLKYPKKYELAFEYGRWASPTFDYNKNNKNPYTPSQYYAVKSPYPVRFTTSYLNTLSERLSSTGLTLKKRFSPRCLYPPGILSTYYALRSALLFSLVFLLTYASIESAKRGFPSVLSLTTLSAFSLPLTSR